MTWSMVTWAKLMLVVTLVTAAFFVAPVADAATCAPERPVSYVVLDHNPDNGDHSGSGADHGICSHGHCHHNGAARLDANDNAVLQAYARPVHALPFSDFPTSISPDGLKRPPRV